MPGTDAKKLDNIETTWRDSYQSGIIIIAASITYGAVDMQSDLHFLKSLKLAIPYTLY